MTKQKAPAAKVTYKANAFLDMRYGDKLQDFTKGSATPILTRGDGSYWAGEGYTHIGEAEVTVTLYSHDKMVQSSIDAFQKQLEKHRADAYMAEQAILEKISKLSALTFEGGEV